MSLETLLADNTAAIKELVAETKALRELRSDNTAAIKELVAETKALRELRSDAIEAVKGAAKPAAKAAAKAAPAAVEPETPAAEPETKAETAASDLPTIEQVNASIAGYVGPEDISKEERTARSAKVAGIIKSVAPEGTAKINAAAVPEGKRDAFIRTMTKLLGEGNLVADEPETADVEDDLLG